MEEIISKQLLLSLKLHGNTVIPEKTYLKYGRKIIEEFCEKEIGKKVKVIKKIDEPFFDDCFSTSRKEKTIIIEVLPGNLPGNKIGGIN